MLKEFNWKQSMSKVWNSLDNKVVEFWFSILKKTRLLSRLNTKKVIQRIRKWIANFINYYNNVRIQEKLNWMVL